MGASEITNHRVGKIETNDSQGYAVNHLNQYVEQLHAHVSIFSAFYQPIGMVGDINQMPVENSTTFGRTT
jgi:hypothetical protein